MGKGGNPVVGNDERDLSWEEIKLHAKNNDKWIVIDQKVYNISEWASRHPGGSRIISHYAGQDASEAFKAFHINMKLVGKYLPALEIGKLSNGAQEKDHYIKEDFAKLAKKAEEMELFKPSKVFFGLTIFHIILFEAMAYFTLRYYGTNWLPYLTSTLFLVISQKSKHKLSKTNIADGNFWDGCMVTPIMGGKVKAQAAYNAHDFGHLSVFNSTRLNHAFQLLTWNLIKGASSSWWRHMHNQHHSKPNVINKDPDVRLYPLFVLGEIIPKKVAEKQVKTFPYDWQHCYFFVLGPLLFPIYFQYMVFRHPIVRREWLDVFLMTLFYIKFFVLYTPMLGFFGAIAFYLLTRCLDSLWFVWVSQSNHVPMDVDEDKERPWLALQLNATCDVEQSLFNDWFTGHLNFQIEHHLFPTMPRHNLYKIQPFAKEMCVKHGIPYKCKTLSEAFRDIIRSLKNSGEIWKSHYQQLHYE